MLITWSNPLQHFFNDIRQINSLPEITTRTTIDADDDQLLFSGIPYILEQLKIYRDKPKNNDRVVQWKWFENEFK